LVDRYKTFAALAAVEHDGIDYRVELAIVLAAAAAALGDAVQG
jgi:hypothetical protein